VKNAGAVLNDLGTEESPARGSFVVWAALHMSLETGRLIQFQITFGRLEFIEKQNVSKYSQ
jgi:hypothetical protein